MKTNSYKIIKILRTNDLLPFALVSIETAGAYLLVGHVARALKLEYAEALATFGGLGMMTAGTLWFGTLHYLTVASWLRLSEQVLHKDDKSESAKIIIEQTPEIGYATSAPIQIAGIVYSDQHHGKFIHVPSGVQVSHIRKMAYGLLVDGKRLSTRAWSEGEAPLLPAKVFDTLVAELLRVRLAYKTSGASNAHVRLTDEGKQWFASYLYGRVPKNIAKDLPPALPEDWEPE